MDDGIVLPRRKTTRRKPTPEVLNDAYYTHDAVADMCVQTLPPLEAGQRYCLVEPGAGGGAFVRALTRHYGDDTPVTAMDVLPTDDAVEQGNWFQWTRTFDDDVRLWVIGNPPFRNQLAMRFFRHAVQCGAALIAMVLPRSWSRDETRRKVDRHYELVHACDVPESAFHHVGKQYHAIRCVWQVWRRLPPGAPLRPLPPRPDYSALAVSLLNGERVTADLVVQRVGEYAGRFLWSDDDITAHLESRNYIYLRLPDAAFAAWLRTSGFSLENHPIVRESSSMPSINTDTLLQELDARRTIFRTLSPAAAAACTSPAAAARPTAQNGRKSSTLRTAPSRKRPLATSDDDD